MFLVTLFFLFFAHPLLSVKPIFFFFNLFLIRTIDTSRHPYHAIGNFRIFPSSSIIQ